MRNQVQPEDQETKVNTATQTLVPIEQTKAIKTYFRAKLRNGRTTTLINAKTGEKLAEFMDILSRKECYSNYARQMAKGGA
jgi:hypothetical protein